MASLPAIPATESNKTSADGRWYRHQGCFSGLYHRLQLGHPAAQVVLAFEDAVDHRVRDGELGVSGQIQYGFHFMRHVPHCVQVQKPGHPFDRVEPPENRVERLGMGGVLVERQQLQLDGGQMFPRFQDEVLKQLGVPG